MHYHMGSQIKTQKSIFEGVKYGFGIYTQLQKIHPNLDTIDIGGGFAFLMKRKSFTPPKEFPVRL